jgi:UDP-glucose 4-epimerase
MVAVNIDATAALLDWSVRVGVKRVIFASTGNVYRSGPGLLDEDAPCDPGSMYAASKLCAEILVRQYARLIEPCILRMFGVYGPGQTGMLIPNMIGRIVSGQEITLAQRIGLSLTPLHIRDCVEMLVRVIKAERYEGTAFNLCGSEIVSLGDIVNRLGILLKREPRVRLNNDPPQWLLGDNARFVKQFGYSPLVRLEEGLTQVVEEYLHANN